MWFHTTQGGWFRVGSFKAQENLPSPVLQENTPDIEQVPMELRQANGPR